MSNKKAQSMPMNVIIVAIIVLVVLVILIAFFAGGFGSVVGKVRDLFTGTTSGQSRDLVIQTCQSLCDSAKAVPEGAQPLSGYCKQSFVVADPNGGLTRYKCGQFSVVKIDESTSKTDKAKKINSAEPNNDLPYSLGIECSDVKCTGV